MDDKEKEPEAAMKSQEAAGNDVLWSPQRVERLRLRLKLNQTEFGKLVGVVRQTVGDWERGDTQPSKLNIVALQELERSLADYGGERVAPQSLPAPGVGLHHKSADYWRGVLYAAETMSETVTRLLREQREAADRMAKEDTA